MHHHHITELSLAAAFIMGLLGSVHCLAMCGGIVSAFSQLPGSGKGAPTTPLAALRESLPYNLGRITSYGVAGLIAGSLGFLLAGALGPRGGMVLRVLFGLVLISAGLYLAGWSQLITKLEAAVRPLWESLSRRTAHLRGGADRFSKAFALGAVWGFLPCGLTYAALMGAAATGSATRGGALMLAFGVGTLPSMLTAGALATRLRAWTARSSVRALAGLLLISMGLWTLVMAGMMRGH